MKNPKVSLSTGAFLFLCAYGIWDPWDSFWVFILSVGLHEVGHLVAICCFREPIYGIRGTLNGVRIHTAPLPYKKELPIAMAGPAVTLLLLLTMRNFPPLWATVNGILLWYNLLPFYPLDGGRILRCTLRLLCPLGLADSIEKIIGIGTYILILSGAVYFTFRLHCGIWPAVFCGFLLLKIKNNRSNI